MRSLSDLIGSTLSALEPILNEAFEAGRAQGFQEGQEAFRQRLEAFLLPPSVVVSQSRPMAVPDPVVPRPAVPQEPIQAENVRQVTWSTRLPA